MSYFILVAGILVSIVLDRQERRHRMELMWEYRRLNLPQPMPRPKLSALQAWLNIILGIVLLLVGSGELATFVFSPIAGQHIMVSVATLFIGGGITLIILGSMALRERRAYQRRGQN